MEQDPAAVYFVLFGASLVALPAMQETWVRSLGQEGPLEEEMTTHSKGSS